MTNQTNAQDARRIQPKNDDFMVANHLRQPKAEYFEFSKTKEERAELAEVKSYQDKIWLSRQSSNTFKQAIKPTAKQRLILHLKNKEHKVDFKTTLRFDVTSDAVSDIISRYKNEIIKSYYNGKLLS